MASSYKDPTLMCVNSWSLDEREEEGGQEQRQQRSSSSARKKEDSSSTTSSTSSVCRNNAIGTPTSSQKTVEDNLCEKGQEKRKDRLWLAFHTSQGDEEAFVSGNNHNGKRNSSTEE